jgi:hypothetical protein
MSAADLLSALVPVGIAFAALLMSMRRASQPIVLPRDYEQMIRLIDTLTARIAALERDVRLVQTWANKLAAQVVQLGGNPISLEEVEAAKNGRIQAVTSDPNRLVQLLKATYNVEELDALAFELKAPDGTLGGGDVAIRAYRLVTWAQRRGRLIDLADAIWRERPDALGGER